MPDARITDLWTSINLAPERRRNRRIAWAIVLFVLYVIWRMI
jgi:hypothetical protein